MKAYVVQVLIGLIFFFGSNSTEETKRALLIVDVQKCFVPGGSLAIPAGDEVVPVINEIRKRFENKFHSVYLSLDFHPPNHVSFASQYVDKRPFDSVTLKYNDRGNLCKPTQLKDGPIRAFDCDHVNVEVEQTLWPDHCVQGTDEVHLVHGLHTELGKDVFIRKGRNPSIDSYSAFFDNGKIESTGFHEVLQNEGITDLFVVGLATDFCVKFSSLDGVSLGYRVYVIKNATRGVTDAGYEAALEEMSEKGIQVIDLEQLENILSEPSK